MTQHIEIDFDGDNFCPTDAEKIAIVIWEELCTRYPKFWFGDPSLKASGNYVFGIAANKNANNIGAVTIGEELKIELNEIPLAAKWPDSEDPGLWRWILADPKSLEEFFPIMDCIYEGFHEYREGQTLQIGNGIDPDEMLDKDQTIKKLYMVIADLRSVQYHREFIRDLLAEINDPFANRVEIGPSDWRSHLIGDVRENWHFLDEMARLLFLIDATYKAKSATNV